MALIAVGAALVSAVLNAVLTPFAGLWGSALAYILTSGFLLTARFLVSRSAARRLRLDP
jgi:O-antigen/teichoic acid export membrane protein